MFLPGPRRSIAKSSRNQLQLHVASYFARHRHVASYTGCQHRVASYHHLAQQVAGRWEPAHRVASYVELSRMVAGASAQHAWRSWHTARAHAQADISASAVRTSQLSEAPAPHRQLRKMPAPRSQLSPPGAACSRPLGVAAPSSRLRRAVTLDSWQPATVAASSYANIIIVIMRKLATTPHAAAGYGIRGSQVAGHTTRS